MSKQQEKVVSNLLKSDKIRDLHIQAEGSGYQLFIIAAPAPTSEQGRVLTNTFKMSVCHIFHEHLYTEK